MAATSCYSDANQRGPREVDAHDAQAAVRLLGRGADAVEYAAAERGRDCETGEIEAETPKTDRQQERTVGAMRAMLLGTIAATLAVSTGDAAQNAQTPQRSDLTSFEVASVKPNISGAREKGMGPEIGGRFGAINMPLRDLLAFAYVIPPSFATSRIAGGPSWLDSERFDITAKAERDVEPDQMRALVRQLLAERFAVKMHWEIRELSVYALVFARPDRAFGPALHRSEIDCVALRAAGRGQPPLQSASKPVCTGRTIPGTITGSALSLNTLSDSLGRFVGRIVQNRTELTGSFDYELTWTADSPSGPPTTTEPTLDSGGPSIFTAIQEQLGLRLESQKGPVEVLVIDHAERPTPN